MRDAQNGQDGISYHQIEIFAAHDKGYLTWCKDGATMVCKGFNAVPRRRPMGPLDERQRYEDVQIARARENIEKGWDAAVRRDTDTAADLLELAAADLRAVNKNKVIPIRGPKG
jgi:hypothetical protein